MPDDAPRSSLADAYLDLHHRLRRHVVEATEGTGVSFARQRLMSMIAQQPETRASDLAQALGFAPRSVTEAIDALERDGLAVRLPDPTDRRAKRVALTEAGRDALERSTEKRRAALDQAFAALDGAEREVLARLLAKVRGGLAD